MRAHVHFRYNVRTGEVESFVVDVPEVSGAPGGDHDREHEALAYELGSLLERRPGVEELLPDPDPHDALRTSPGRRDLASPRDDDDTQRGEELL